MEACCHAVVVAVCMIRKGLMTWLRVTNHTSDILETDQHVLLVKRFPQD